MLKRCALLLTSTASATRIQIAIVGAGPSGFYVAQQLLKKSDNIHVDIFEKLPVPFGLVRYGVAPDHADVKNVENSFRELLQHDRVTFLGNIDVGKDITIGMLMQHYGGVVVAVGAENDTKLNVPGESLMNVVAARHFVGYYNTLPHPYGVPTQCPLPLEQPNGNVLILGNGNVAMDCARVLAAPYKYWCPTCMNCHACRSLMNSRVANIFVVARRGVEHAAFSTKEFRELSKIHESVRVIAEPFDLQKLLQKHCEGGNRALKRKLELVHEHCVPDVSKLFHSGRKVAFRFNLKIREFVADGVNKKAVSGALFDSPDSSEKVFIPCNAVIKSIGFQCDGLRGVPFNIEKKVIPSVAGRVANSPRLYVSGWAKTGPKGTIANTLIDAQETAASILEDITNGSLPESSGKFGLVDTLTEREVTPVMMGGLKRIWKVEEDRGFDLGKKLEKVRSIHDMLDLALGGRLGRRASDRFKGRCEPRPPGCMLLEEFLDDDTPMVNASSNSPRAKLVNEDWTPHRVKRKF